ncbi:hypothetical protein NC652_014833 [Populus alba x Populus x berolinensis]|uniref:Uncharacterized protein n=1 Tax=Populus alba x Populus x berolinensis TaxID=444605 RepID=A0AAD6W4C6_9ROSI|nr:hypothetical protein NC652_014833 [Populus alba x Populus x berolinensis]KAJ6998730.1 hypothetical protein NC653_014787 [Populus alba x Populus x berolinensis]
MAAVELRGDEGTNSIADDHTKVNVTFLDPAKLQGSQNKTSNTEAVVNYNKNRGGSGWGWGGGGGGWYKWGCGGKGKGGGGGSRGVNNHRMHRKRVFSNEDYKLGEFAQCTRKGRCKGMRLDCPLHCGGPCFYDCQHMCKAHCRRP